MMNQVGHLRIDEQRFREDFACLCRDGATPEDGLNRPALSEAHLTARQTFRDMILERGFDLRQDGAGNLSALHCPSSDLQPTLLLGSHLDSVPHGGRYDGTLGVASAFEVAQVLREVSPDTPVEVIDFTDEEGTWVSLLGSRAMSGQLTPKDLERPRGNLDAFHRALQRSGLTIDGILSSTRHSKEFLGYLEVHIEQGTRLECHQTDIGIVTGMVGIHMYLVTFHGEANHAGTTPMNERHDAALGASEFCIKVHQTVKSDFPDCMATVGQMDFSSGAFNIIAGKVTAFMEIRSEDSEQAKDLENALREQAEIVARTYWLNIDFDHLESVIPQKMDARIARSIESSCQRLELSYQTLPSLAGHDAQSMALLCPSGLIFIPSSGGFSHSSREYTPWEACINGANVLLHSAIQFMDSVIMKNRHATELNRSS
ncbi:MAG: Zn-dependent hydrolase [Bacteroidetes bacterium]|nr:Zn-dependent hydrolase [Bacteroidota bacterium]